ncbi:MAG: HEAT repeat domain-containing protein [Candidatus Wallbacteria bacterium]|nr:HEAT repeat domain-containing protein [Candidatus Wallbacteria bacterium]
MAGTGNENFNQVVLEQVENYQGTSLGGRKTILQRLTVNKRIPESDKISFFRWIVTNETDPELRADARRLLNRFESGGKAADSSKLPGRSEPSPDAERIDLFKAITGGSRNMSVSDLIKELHAETDIFVLATIISAFGAVGGREDAPELVPFLSHPDSRVRANTVEALKHLGNETTYEHIIPLLNDTDARVKANVARLLARSGIFDTLRVLKQMVASGKRNQIESALYALQKMDHPLAREVAQDAKRKLEELILRGNGDSPSPAPSGVAR